MPPEIYHNIKYLFPALFMTSSDILFYLQNFCLIFLRKAWCEQCQLTDEKAKKCNQVGISHDLCYSCNITSVNIRFIFGSSVNVLMVGPHFTLEKLNTDQITHEIQRSHLINRQNDLTHCSVVPGLLLCLLLTGSPSSWSYLTQEIKGKYKILDKIWKSLCVLNHILASFASSFLPFPQSLLTLDHNPPHLQSHHKQCSPANYALTTARHKSAAA